MYPGCEMVRMPAFRSRVISMPTNSVTGCMPSSPILICSEYRRLTRMYKSAQDEWYPTRMLLAKTPTMMRASRCTCWVRWAKTQSQSRQPDRSVGQPRWAPGYASRPVGAAGAALPLPDRALCDCCSE
eukprot:scaffold7529_cov143-Isochrysis_galbana.AAC.2